MPRFHLKHRLRKAIIAVRPKRAAIAPPPRPDAVTEEMAGGWVAWAPDGLKILGHGSTIAGARESAGNLPGLVLVKVPPPEELRPSGVVLEANAD